MMRCGEVRRRHIGGALREKKRSRAQPAAARFLRTLPSQALPQPRVGRSAMSDRSLAFPPSAFSAAVASKPAAAGPVAARTKLLLEGPVLPTLLRLSAPN